MATNFFIQIEHACGANKRARKYQRDSKCDFRYREAESWEALRPGRKCACTRIYGSFVSFFFMRTLGATVL